MIKDLPAIMACSDHPLYALRILSSDFFLLYWGCFLPTTIPSQYAPIIQKQARMSVDYSMLGEPIYWNIDFSEPTMRKTWDIFVQGLQTLPQNICSDLRTLIFQLSESDDESRSADLLINVITRIRFQDWFREEVQFTQADADILDCVYEQSNDFMDLREMEEKWLMPQSPWDEKLKQQTPDDLGSLCIIFSMAYDPRTNLPLIKENLKTVLGTEAAYDDFVAKLKLAFEHALPENVRLDFPKMM